MKEVKFRVNNKTLQYTTRIDSPHKDFNLELWDQWRPVNRVIRTREDVEKACGELLLTIFN